MQGTWVWSLVQEDYTCNGAAKPECHSYWARKLQLLKPLYLEPGLLNKSNHQGEEPAHYIQRSPRSLQLEKVREQQRRFSATKQMKLKKKIGISKGPVEN